MPARRSVVVGIAVGLVAVVVGLALWTPLLREAAPPGPSDEARAPDVRTRDVPRTTLAPRSKADVPDSVTVFYATDRARFVPDGAWYLRRLLLPGALLAIGLGAFLLRRRKLGAVLMVAALAWSAWKGWGSWRMAQRAERLD